jgi:hypothetical protein
MDDFLDFFVKEMDERRSQYVIFNNQYFNSSNYTWKFNKKSIQLQKYTWPINMAFYQTYLWKTNTTGPQWGHIGL